MATWSIQPPEEGDPIVAADLQSEMTAAQAAVNDLEKESIPRRSLRGDIHAPTLHLGHGQIIREGPGGGDYNVTTANASRASVSGWERLSWAAGAPVTSLATDTLASETASYFGIALSSTVDLDDSTIAGIEAGYGFHVRTIYDSTLAQASGYHMFVAILQIHVSGGNWSNVPRTYRFTNSNGIFGGVTPPDPIWRDMGWEGMIRASDIASGSRVVDGLRVVGCFFNCEALGGAVAGPTVALRAGHLFAHAEQAGGP
jgi:hypothetical protein